MAKESGWSFRAEGHFGRIRCPFEDHDGGCELAIFSTSGDQSGTATANKIRGVMRSCDKRSDRTSPLSSSLVDDAIERVELIVAAAEALRDSDDLVRRSEAALDEVAADSMDNEEAALETALQLEEEAQEAELNAWQTAIEGGVIGDWPPEERAEELAAAARDRLAEILSQIGEDALDREVRQRISGLQEKLAEFAV